MNSRNIFFRVADPDPLKLQKNRVRTFKHLKLLKSLRSYHDEKSIKKCNANTWIWIQVSKSMRIRICNTFLCKNLLIYFASEMCRQYSGRRGIESLQFRMFYRHNGYSDVKTFDGQKPEYLLTGLQPYTK